MSDTGCVRYLRDEGMGAEVIVCRGSAISYPPHNHVSVFTVSLVLGGSIVLSAGEAARVCAAGDVFALPPYVPHAIEAREPYSMLTVCLDKGRISQYNTDKIIKNIQFVLHSADAPPLDERQTARLLECLKVPREDAIQAAEPFVERARAVIEHHPEAPLRVDALARALYVSEYHFIRRFKRAVGLTPRQFLIQNRVRRVQRLLRTTDKTQAEAALTAGFCDQSHFIHQFERIVGLTPSAYRASCEAIP